MSVMLKKLLKKFEPFKRPAVFFEKVSEEQFTKYGGLPNAPKELVWPTYEGKQIPFFMQIDFADINANGYLTNYPTKGLLYIFLDTFTINDGYYDNGLAFKILFFDANKSDTQKIIPNADTKQYNEYFLSTKQKDMYPNTEFCCDARHIIEEMDEEGDGDLEEEYYDYFQESNCSETYMCGWMNELQGGTYETCCEDGRDWELLFQFISDDDDEDYIWGDVGYLYFYIPSEDLKKRKFDDVYMEMQCS